MVLANWVDYLLLGVVVFSTGISLWKGFLRDMASVISAVVALVVAALGYEWAGRLFEDLTRDQEVARGIGFLSLFFGVLLLGAIVAFLLRKLFTVSGLSWFDHFLGGIFGVLRGILVGSVFLLILTAFEIKQTAVAKSRLSPYFIVCARGLVLVMPEELRTKFRAGYYKFRRVLFESEAIRNQLK